MATHDPSSSIAALSDAALLRAHDRLHEMNKAVAPSPEDSEAHHLIAEEIRKRGLDHPISEDVLHDVVVTMSTVNVPVRSLAKMLGPNEVRTIAQMAMANGSTFASVHELLTANGWVLRAEPAPASDEDLEEVLGEEPAYKSMLVKRVDEQRFTLGPWYVPNELDAHNEWTDPDELQTALWDYVKKGNREIRLQHKPETRAGEWVEAMTLPFEFDAPLMNPETGRVSKRTFPAGTVMLGVQWDDWAWDMVKSGKIRGYSIGGSSERREEDPPIMVDLDTEAQV